MAFRDENGKNLVDFRRDLHFFIIRHFRHHQPLTFDLWHVPPVCNYCSRALSMMSDPRIGRKKLCAKTLGQMKPTKFLCFGRKKTLTKKFFKNIYSHFYSRNPILYGSDLIVKPRELWTLMLTWNG